jgi:hypothetical protein
MIFSTAGSGPNLRRRPAFPAKTIRRCSKTGSSFLRLMSDNIGTK